MLGSSRSRSFTLAALAAIGLGVSYQVPAYATALTITSLSCETTTGGGICDGYVSGGTPAYSYTWNPYSGHVSNFSDHSTTTIYCAVGTSVLVTFTVQDSAGATASKSTYLNCTGGHA